MAVRPYVKSSLPINESLLLDKCDKDDFSCGNGNCIENWAKCNGYDNCGDQSDEEGCTGKKVQ